MNPRKSANSACESCSVAPWAESTIHCTLRLYVGMAPHPRKQLIARVSIDLEAVVQIIQLDCSLYAMNSSPFHSKPSLSNTRNGMCTTFNHSTLNGFEKSPSSWTRSFITHSPFRSFHPTRLRGSVCCLVRSRRDTHSHYSDRRRCWAPRCAGKRSETCRFWCIRRDAWCRGKWNRKRSI